MRVECVVGVYPVLVGCVSGVVACVLGTWRMCWLFATRHLKFKRLVSQCAIVFGAELHRARMHAMHQIKAYLRKGEGGVVVH